MAKQLRITLVGSLIGEKPRTRDAIRSLGLRKIRQSTERPDTPDVWGQIAKARHLLEVEEA